jgi:hypothetical protein
MSLGIRTLLLVLSVVLFILAALSDTNWPDFIACGLAAFAAAHAVSELGFDRPLTGAPRRDTTT